MDQSETEKQSNLENLPPEMIQHIAKYLDFKSVTVLALTSRYMNNVLNDSCLWKHIYYRDAKKILEQCERKLQKVGFIDLLTCFQLSNYSYLVELKLSKVLDKPPSNWKEFYKSERLHIYLRLIEKMVIIEYELDSWIKVSRYERNLEMIANHKKWHKENIECFEGKIRFKGSFGKSI